MTPFHEYEWLTQRNKDKKKNWRMHKIGEWLTKQKKIIFTNTLPECHAKNWINNEKGKINK